MFNIRIANLNHTQDAHALIALMNQYACHPMGGSEPLSPYAKENLVSTLLGRNDYIGILAFDGDEAIGLCNCFEGFSTFACKPLLNIHDVYVSQHYRGQSIARRMIKLAHKSALERDCCKLTLEVLTDNTSAKKSYRALGFEPYRLDAKFGQAEFWHKPITESH